VGGELLIEDHRQKTGAGPPAEDAIETLRIIDDRDKPIIGFDDNGHYTDKESHIRFKRPDKSTRIVEDHLGNRVLFLK
jgi:hypothetical protein